MFFGKPFMGKREAPGDLRQRRGNVHCRGAGDARFAGLGGDIDLEPELITQAARLHYRTHAAKLDGFQARPAHGVLPVKAAQVLERMNALVGPDRDVAGCVGSRRHCRHAGDVIGADGLLEEIEACIRDRAHILHRLLRAPALVGVG